MAQLQAQVDALMAAGEMAADAADQLDQAVQALEARAALLRGERRWSGRLGLGCT